MARELRKEAVIEHDRRAGDFEDWYEEVREDYFRSSFSYGRKKLEAFLREILDSLPKNSSLLDVGCGTGEHVRLAAGCGLQVVGIEPAERMRSIARRLNRGIRIEDGDITALPFEENRFDCILAIEVLRYLHRMDHQQAYREVARVLRPGAIFVFTAVTPYSLDGFFLYHHVHAVLNRLRGGKAPIHCEFASATRVRRDLRAAGFEEVEVAGRMFGPLRLVYKVRPKWGAAVARFAESFDDWISAMSWTAPVSGHMIIVARRSGSSRSLESTVTPSR